MKDSWKQFFLGAVAAVVLFAVGAGIFFLVRRDNGRFVEVQHYAGRRVTETIVQDRETGVYYLMISERGYQGKSAMTPLLDSEGRPVTPAGEATLTQTAQAPVDPQGSEAEEDPAPLAPNTTSPAPALSVSSDPSAVPGSEPPAETPIPAPSALIPDYSTEEALAEFESFLQSTLNFLQECEDLREERLQEEQNQSG